MRAAPWSRAATVAQRPIGPWPKIATSSPRPTRPFSTAAKPPEATPPRSRTCSSVKVSGIGTRLACAKGIRTNSACAPSIVLPSRQPPRCPWQCAACPFRQLSHWPQGVVDPNNTRCPGSYPKMSSPSSCTTPTASCPSVSPGRTGNSPFTMWRSVAQTDALVTRTIASPIAGLGTGFVSIPKRPGARKTLAHIVGRGMDTSAVGATHPAAGKTTG